MRRTPILINVLIPVILLIVLLTAIIVGVGNIIFRKYEATTLSKEILQQAEIISETVQSFVAGIYNQANGMTSIPSLYEMNADELVAIFKATAETNEYMELVYLQDMDGQQIARSSGTLGNRKTVGGFLKWKKQKKLLFLPPIIL